MVFIYFITSLCVVIDFPFRRTAVAMVEICTNIYSDVRKERFNYIGRFDQVQQESSVDSFSQCPCFVSIKSRDGNSHYKSTLKHVSVILITMFSFLFSLISNLSFILSLFLRHY